MRKTLICAAMAAALALTGLAGTASAASKAVSLKVKTVASPNPVNKGTYSGKPFGKGKCVQSEDKDENRSLKLTVKGGTITFSLAGGPNADNTKIVGNWKVVKGTGKYKKAKGKGTLTADFKGNATYKGKISY